MLTKVKAHTRRGHPVRAHSRQTPGASVDATQRDQRQQAIVREVADRLAAELSARQDACQHDGTYTYRSVPSPAHERGLRWFVCQQCGAVIAWEEMAAWAASGRVRRAQIETQ